MHRRSPARLVAIAAALFTTLAALPAIAAPAVDTSFIRGYDEEIRSLVFGVAALDDTENACAGLAAEDTELDISETGETATVGTALEDDAAEPDASVESIGDDDEGDMCELQMVDASGPNGQVNHGTIVSSFVHALQAFDLPFNGKGCLIRHIAQSDWGQGDQQVKVGDADQTESIEDDSGAETTVTTSVVLLAIDDVDCVHGKADRSDEDAPGKSGEAKDRKHDREKGKPDHAGRPDDAGKPSDTGSQGKGHGKKH